MDKLGYSLRAKLAYTIYGELLQEAPSVAYQREQLGTDFSLIKNPALTLGEFVREGLILQNLMCKLWNLRIAFTRFLAWMKDFKRCIMELSLSCVTTFYDNQSILFQVW